MFCPKCGNELPEGAKFCNSCGADLGSLVGEGASGEEAVAASAAAGVADAAADVAAGTAGNAGAAEAAATGGGVAVAAAAPKQISKRVVGIAIAAIVVVVAVVIAYFLFFAPYNLDERTFPDAAVRTALASQADADKDGKISRDEAKALRSLNLAGSGVMSLDGLDKFPNLASLDLSSASSLRQADFSKTRALTELNVAASGLASLDVTPLASLESLKASDIDIASADLSKNEKLTALTLNDGIAVFGLESTGLREQYVMVGYENEGIQGSPDGQGGSGVYDEIRTDFTYDDDNVLTSYSSTNTSSYSDDSYTYGRRYTIENGKVVASETTGSYSNNDWEVEYDEAGRPSAVYDYYKSSSSSSTTVDRFTYDDAGRLSTRVTDWDSSSDSNYSYDYNDAGQLVSVDCDSGSSDWGSSFTYDNAGRVITAQSDYQLFEFTYNDAGQLATKSYQFLDDGVATGEYEVTVTFQYDELGRVKSAERRNTGSSDSSGDWYYTADVTYNAQGLVERIDRLSHSEYKGEVDEYDGAATFEYRRVFTAKDAADVEMPMLVGDPTTTVYSNMSLNLKTMDRAKQDPIAYLTCTDWLTYSNVYM